MKKRIIIVLIPIFVLVTIMAASYFFDYKKQSKIVFSDDIVTLEIKEKTLRYNKATVIITNKSDKELNYNDYHIEKYDDENWYEIELTKEKVSAMPGNIISPNQSIELDINWEYLYGELDGGHYRIVCSFWQDKYTEKIYAAAEFELGVKETN